MTIEIPDYELLRPLIVGLEAKVHEEQGFGSLPLLITMCMDEESISLIEMDVDFHDAHPAQFLSNLALTMFSRNPQARPFIEQLIADRTFGWILVFETNTNFETEPLNTVLGVPLEQFPGTKLTRLVLGIDLEARVYSVVRQQGEEPIDLCGVSPQMNGAIPAALLGLNVAVASNVRGGEELTKKLMSFHLLTQDEMDMAALKCSPAAWAIQDMG